jgi:hypothetical protein
MIVHTECTKRRLITLCTITWVLILRSEESFGCKLFERLPSEVVLTHLEGPVVSTRGR